MQFYLQMLQFIRVKCKQKKNKLGLNLFHHTRKDIALFAVYML